MDKKQIEQNEHQNDPLLSSTLVDPEFDIIVSDLVPLMDNFNASDFTEAFENFHFDDQFNNLDVNCILNMEDSKLENAFPQIGDFVDMNSIAIDSSFSYVVAKEDEELTKEPEHLSLQYVGEIGPNDELILGGYNDHLPFPQWMKMKQGCHLHGTISAPNNNMIDSVVEIYLKETAEEKYIYYDPPIGITVFK